MSSIDKSLVGEFRPLRDLLREIARAAKRDPDALGRAFTAREARVLFTDLLAERGMEKFESYLEVSLDRARVDMSEMARLNAETVAAAIERFKGALSDYAGRVATPVAQWAGDNPLSAAAGGAVAAGGIWWGSRRLLRGRRGRTPGAPGTPGESGPGLRTMRVQTMRVQTLIARRFRGGPGGKAGGRGGLGKIAAFSGVGALLARLRGSVGRALRRSPVFGGGAAALAGIPGVVSALSSGDNRAATQEAVGALGAGGGTWAGIKGGALLGTSLFGPAGAIPGGVIGGLAGSYLGDALFDSLAGTLLDRAREPRDLTAREAASLRRAQELARDLALQPRDREPALQPRDREPALQPRDREPALQPWDREPALQPWDRELARDLALQPRDREPALQPWDRELARDLALQPRDREPALQPRDREVVDLQRAQALAREITGVAPDQSVHVTINGPIYAEDRERLLDDLAERVRDAQRERSAIIDPPPDPV